MICCKIDWPRDFREIWGHFMTKQSGYDLHWVCQQPTPYNDYLFQSLASDAEIELTVHFIQPVLESHPWQSIMARGFQHRYFHRTLGIDWHTIDLAVKRRKGLFVVGGWNDPTLMLLLSYLSLRGQPFGVWTDTPVLNTYRRPIKRMLRAKWLLWIFRNASNVMSTGQPGLLALKHMGCPTSKEVNFPFFINLDAFSPQYRHELLCSTDTPIRFVSAGRLQNSIKGHEVALKALARAKEMTQNSNFTYEIVGAGPDREWLQNEVDALRLNSQVHFVGWLEPTPLCDLFNSSHALIHPSRVDPFPVAILEAMASGMLVLGSDVCGSVQDRIRHGENGLVHKAGDAEELAQQIAHVLEQPSIIPQLGRAARKTAEEWPVSRGITVIKQLLKEAHEPRH
jgi:glycosyltransferase involved in cell wall biosynthesis